MADFYRRRYAEKEWTKKVDISILFRLEKATARIKTIADRDQLKPILEEVEQLEIALNIAQGRVKDFPLKEHEMPEDTPKTEYRRSTKKSIRIRKSLPG